MRNFIINIFIYTLILFAISFCLGEIEFSDEFIVSKTKDTPYEKVGWNLNMIKNHPEKIKNSIIFLGSSYVLGGVNDSILKNQGHNAINFAVRHNGNDLSLYFLKRLKLLKPKAVFFLKGKTNFTELHKLTPLLIRPTSLFKDGQTLNGTFVSYLFKRVKLVFEYLIFKGSDTDAYSAILKNKYGIVFDTKQMSNVDFNSNETIKRLARVQERFAIYKNDYLFADEKFNDTFINKVIVLKRMATKFYLENNFITNCDSQDSFIKEARLLCDTNNIDFYQLYVPVVSDVRPYTGYLGELYRQKDSDFKVLALENYYFLNNYLYWADEHHLTEKGAEIFTNKLSKKMLETLQVAK